MLHGDIGSTFGNGDIGQNEHYYPLVGAECIVKRFMM